MFISKINSAMTTVIIEIYPTIFIGIFREDNLFYNITFATANCPFESEIFHCKRKAFFLPWKKHFKLHYICCCRPFFALPIKGSSLRLTLADKHKEQPSSLLISSAWAWYKIADSMRKISILTFFRYHKSRQRSYIGKISVVGTRSNLGIVLEHITNIAEVKTISIYRQSTDIWFFGYHHLPWSSIMIDQFPSIWI